jgi:hypothetical protein
MREEMPLMVLAIITLGIQVAGSATVFAQDNGRNSGRPHGGWVVPCSLASIRLTIRASSAIPPPPDPMASSDRRAAGRSWLPPLTWQARGHQVCPQMKMG